MKRVFLTALLGASLGTLANAQVVINEFNYDDSSTDQGEFIELYNAGGSSVDISSWTIELGDNTIDNTITIPASTSIAAGGYYVVGLTAVTPKDLTTAVGLQSDAEYISLKNASAVIQDSVAYERFNTGVANTILTGNGEPATTGGIFGQHLMADAPTNSGIPSDPTASANKQGGFTLQRMSDGYDTGDNELDFGIAQATIKAANFSNGTVTLGSLPYINNFDDAEDTLYNALPATFVGATAQDPATADTIGVGAKNPQAIAASPQGGNIGLFWDSSGGGNGVNFNLAGAIADVEVEAYYFLPAFSFTTLVSGDNEEATLALVRGRVDSNNTIGTTNGDTGIRWRLTRSFAASATTLTLEERKNGVVTQIGSAQTITTSGWYRLLLRVKGTEITGIVGGTYGNYGDGTLLSGTATITRAGGIGFGYRELIATNANASPIRLDALRIRPAPAAAVNDWSLFM